MPERSDEVLRQQVQLLYDNSTVVLLANLVGAGLVAAMLGPELAETASMLRRTRAEHRWFGALVVRAGANQTENALITPDDGAVAVHDVGRAVGVVAHHATEQHTIAATVEAVPPHLMATRGRDTPAVPQALAVAREVTLACVVAACVVAARVLALELVVPAHLVVASFRALDSVAPVAGEEAEDEVPVRSLGVETGTVTAAVGGGGGREGAGRGKSGCAKCDDREQTFHFVSPVYLFALLSGITGRAAGSSPAAGGKRPRLSIS